VTDEKLAASLTAETTELLPFLAHHASVARLMNVERAGFPKWVESCYH